MDELKERAAQLRALGYGGPPTGTNEHDQFWRYADYLFRAQHGTSYQLVRSFVKEFGRHSA